MTIVLDSPPNPRLYITSTLGHLSPNFGKTARYLTVPSTSEYSNHYDCSIWIWQDYICEDLLVLHDSLQRESLKLYCSPALLVWLQLVRKLMNTDTSTSPTAGTPWSTRTRLRALSRLVTSSYASLNFPAPKAAEFVEVILLYFLWLQSCSHYIIIIYKSEVGLLQWMPRSKYYVFFIQSCKN